MSVQNNYKETAVRIVDNLHPLSSPDTDSRIAIAQVYALLADAIRSLND